MIDIKTSNHLDGLSHGLELSAPARPLTTVASYSQTSAVVVPTKLANIVTLIYIELKQSKDL